MVRKVLKGIPVSAGIAIGKCVFINRGAHRSLPKYYIGEDQVEDEVVRLRKAFAVAARDLARVRKKVPSELGEHASIIDSHMMILKDPKLKGVAVKYIKEGLLNAEWSLDKAVDDLEEIFSAIEDEYIRERLHDIQLVAQRVQDRMVGQREETGPITQRVILLAHDLTPADTIELDVSKIMALATTMGGKTSHVGIIARSLQIAAVVGVSGLDEEVRDGDLVIIDGLKGKVLIDPDEEELARYADRKYQFENYQRSIIRFCHLPGETVDGYRIQVHANIEVFEEVAAVLDNGAEGIGLYRTEYSYITRDELPTQEQLLEDYRDLASIMYPRKVVIRTVDLGADKFSHIFGPSEESNPALGLRGIRFCLKHPEIFKTQLKAIFRAGLTGNVGVMLPMISGMNELQNAKEVYFEAQRELEADGVEFNPDIPLGVMIELPSAVMAADQLATEVDFFSIGTNDLIQYSLGIDRGNKLVSYLYQPLHPGLIRSLKYIVDAAHAAGIEVSVCGEIAADPFVVPILMGMQIDSISLTPQAIPGIKRVIRQATMAECKDLLKKVLESPSVSLSNKLVRETIFRRFPEELLFYSSLVDLEEV